MRGINNHLPIVIETLKSVLSSDEPNYAKSIFSMQGVIFRYFAHGDSTEVYGEWTNSICTDLIELNESIWSFDGYSCKFRAEKIEDVKEFAIKWISHIERI